MSGRFWEGRPCLPGDEGTSCDADVLPAKEGQIEQSGCFEAGGLQQEKVLLPLGTVSKLLYIYSITNQRQAATGQRYRGRTLENRSPMTVRKVLSGRISQFAVR